MEYSNGSNSAIKEYVDEKVAQAKPEDYEAVKAQVESNTGIISDLTSEVNTLKRENALLKFDVKNLKEASEGNLYTETSAVYPDDPVFGDSVPDKALSGAVVSEVRGRTVAWNQMVLPYTDFVATSGTSIQSKTDTEVTFTASSSYGGLRSATRYNFIGGHKYYISAEANNNGNFIFSNDNGSVATNSANGTKNVTDIGNGFYRHECVCNCQTTLADKSIFIWDNRSSGNTSITIRNLVIVDLTQLGTEDLNFVRQYAEAHPEYDAGSLVSASNVKVRSEGRNVFWDDNLAKATGWQKNSDGYWYGTIGNWMTYFGYNYFVKSPSKPRWQISMDAYCDGGSPRILVQYTDGTSDKHLIDATSSTHYDFITAEGKTVANILSDYGSGRNNILYIKNMMFCPNDSGNALPFSAESSSTLDLSFLDSVPDIGIEGTVVDLQNKTVTWNYKKSILPSDGWVHQWSQDEVWKIFSFDGMKQVSSNSEVAKIIHPIYQSVNLNDLSNGTKGIALRSDGYLYIRNDGSVPSGEIVYELATPITKTFAELGLSDIITNLPVEGNGTITVLSDGAQASAKVEYLIKTN